MKTVLLDLDNTGMTWLDSHAENLVLEELVTLEQESSEQMIPLHLLHSYSGWDYLLVFAPEETEDRLNGLLSLFSIPEEKVIWPSVLSSLIRHREAAYYMFDEHVKRKIEYFCNSTNQKYVTCTVDDVSFINTANDLIIMPHMLLNQSCWAQDEMETFLSLSKQHFRFTPQQTIFCDIGANIGTTCIYFKKKLDPGISILAFEPVSEIFRSLQCNMILNNIPEPEYTLVNKGLSDQAGAASVIYDPFNPGGSALTIDDQHDSDSVSLVSFDDYLTEQNISPDTIKYLWIDIEGYEGAFMAGAVNTLSRIDVPIAMEFTPEFLERNHSFDRLMQILKQLYRKYICLQNPAIIRDIDDLYEFRSNPSVQGNAFQFDVFLLK